MSDDLETSYTASFDAVLRDEHEWLARRRVATGMAPPQDDVIGLALSGGGIRSATFNLGVLEALEAQSLMRQVDYLSSVSGGGYVATCYSWLRATITERTLPTFTAPLANGTGTVVDWLRAHGKYLIAHRGFSLWTLFGAILTAVVLNVLVLGPPLMLVVDAMTLGWLPIDWPAFLEWTAVRDHHGYWLLLAAALVCFALFPFAALAFALVAGIAAPAADRVLERLRIVLGRLLAGGTALLAIGSIPIAAEAFESLLRQHWADAAGLGDNLAYLATLASGGLALWRGAAGITVGRQRLAMVGLALVVYSILIAAYALAVLVDVIGSPVFLGLLALSLLLGLFCNLNAVSIHAYYRDRLGHAFMPEVAGARVQSPAHFMLAQLGPEAGAPLHLLNTTLNTSSSPCEKQRSRQGASFFFSQLYYGSDPTGFRRVDAVRDDLRLITASAVSGAAVDPDSPVTRSRALSFLMALFNLRLGYWARNPNPDARAGLPLPAWWRRIGREMLGVDLDGRHRDIHLSDGGQFDNLGIYELMRRRVKYLVVVDAGCDPDDALADLGAAIERVRVDFGAQIDIAVAAQDPSRPVPGCRVGSIVYADGSTGSLLYLKPAMHPGASAEIYAYWRAHPLFPNEPTSEQFFGEQQFEAYRQLGREAIEAALGDGACADFAQWVASHEVAKPTGP